MTFVSFLAGLAFATFGAAGVFFFKFWKASGDRFFLLFCAACWLLSLERLALTLVSSMMVGPTGPFSVTETSAYVYLIRLVAFACMLAAIIEKNRATGARG